MMIRKVGGLIVATLAICAIALAQPGRGRPGGPGAPGGPGPELLRKMLQSQPGLRFSGTRIVEFRNGPDRVRNTEILLKDGERQRIEFSADSPNAGQIIVESGRERRQYFPDKNEIQVLRPRREEMIGRLGMLARQIREGGMRFRVEGGGEIAGIGTKQMILTDPQGNVVQRMWIDPDSGMLLKREIFDPVGTRIGYFEFTKVTFNPRFAPDDFRILRKGAKVVTIDDLVGRFAKRLGFSPTRIPVSEPYELEDVRPVDLGARKGMMQLYAGQRGRFSLYQISGDIDQRRLERLADGPRLDVFSWRNGERTFILVGDVGRAELERLSKTLR